jgi:hypothetical protein
MTDEEAALLLRHFPELADRYLALVEEADTDPEAPAALAELAEYAAELAQRADGAGAVLVRLMAGVEALSARSPEAEELVAGAFLDYLSPDDLRRLTPWMGSATRAVLDDLELPLTECRDDGSGRRPSAP